MGNDAISPGCHPLTNVSPGSGAAGPGSAARAAELRQAWHIVFGTYGTRLHGDERLTVDRPYNRPGERFFPPNEIRKGQERARMSAQPVLLMLEQQVFVERVIPELCRRGGWRCRVCAAGPNHVHALLDAPVGVPGKRVRAWLKRWLSQALSSRWECPRRRDGMSWWAEGGAAKHVFDPEYFDNAFNYIANQRATNPEPGPAAPDHGRI